MSGYREKYDANWVHLSRCLLTGTVTLEDGFIVEKGATFAVYPACF